MKRFQWIDSHCHFDFSAFDADRQALYDQAVEMGMVAMIIPGVTPDQSAQQFAVVDHYSNIYGAIGLHPWWVEGWLYSHSERHLTDSDDLGDRLEGGEKRVLYKLLAEQVEQYGAVAIGECGLDAAIETPMEQQLQIADIQCKVAVDLNLPLILHVRRAHNEMQALLKRFNLPRGGVVHAFSGSFELANAYIKKGVCLGVGGLITYPRANKSRKAFAQVPLEYIVTETDAPDMPLYSEQSRKEQGQQGGQLDQNEKERNLPTYLPEIISVLAELRGESEASVAKVTATNSRRLFAI